MANSQPQHRSQSQTMELYQLRKNIGRNIHDCRMRQKMALKQLSRQSGISIAKLDLFEMGKYNMKLIHLVTVAMALNTNTARLMEY